MTSKFLASARISHPTLFTFYPILYLHLIYSKCLILNKCMTEFFIPFIWGWWPWILNEIRQKKMFLFFLVSAKAVQAWSRRRFGFKQNVIFLNNYKETKEGQGSWRCMCLYSPDLQSFWSTDLWLPFRPPLFLLLSPCLFLSSHPGLLVHSHLWVFGRGEPFTKYLHLEYS